MKKKLVKSIVSVLALAIIASSLLLMQVSAVSYSGKGTKSNPYLVETAEQLMGMENNLSACYKLNNTIDLSGVTFEPIGNLAKPFTGTFTCDTDSDGTPKFAIKNATMTGKSFDSLAKQNNDYKNNQDNDWEVGLFRTISGATLNNIAVLDANVTCGIIGDNWQNADFTFNKGMGDQGVGIIAGIAKDSTISGCIATGKVNATGSAVSGFIGTVKNSTIEKSYTTATVKADGKWCVGGMVGSVEKLTISNCFSEAVVTTSANTPGSFLGGVDKGANIKNCYCTGSVSNYGNNLYVGTPSNVENCTTTVQDIGVKKITDFSKYVPKPLSAETAAQTQTPNGTSTSDSQTNTNTTTNTTTSAASNASSSEAVASTMTAEELTKKLLEYEASQIKGWDLDQALAVVALKTEYTKMPSEEAEKVAVGDLTLMNKLYDSATIVIIKDLTEEIDKMPSADKITADNCEKVIKICEKYNSLPEDLQTMFNSKRIAKVKECYEKAKSLEGVQVVDQTVSASSSQAEKILIIILVTVNVILIGVAVTFALLMFKNLKIRKKDKAPVITE